MSEYICSGRGFSFEGCNDCQGLRRVVSGKVPKRDRPAHACTCDPRWVLFTKRTDDPKLGWIERQLTLRGIPSHRAGESFHAPILEVPEAYSDAAWALLNERVPGRRKRVDDIADDDPLFEE